MGPATLTLEQLQQLEGAAEERLRFLREIALGQPESYLRGFVLGLTADLAEAGSDHRGEG